MATAKFTALSQGKIVSAIKALPTGRVYIGDEFFPVSWASTNIRLESTNRVASSNLIYTIIGSGNSLPNQVELRHNDVDEELMVAWGIFNIEGGTTSRDYIYQLGTILVGFLT